MVALFVISNFRSLSLDGGRYSIELADQSTFDQFCAAIDLFLHDVTQQEFAAVFCEIWALSTRIAFAAELLANVQLRERKQLRLD